jgi:nitroimidazol reductase NimA-like FMN-containing flavoprotein (pyridoxamine 5'-phosphate oxidase superfamily)
MATQVLSSTECLELLATQRVGRLAVIAGGFPRVFPVNYALDGDVIVFRTAPGSKLTAAQHANVGFQVDHVDEARRSGWSVMVTGMAETVTDEHTADLVRRTQALPIQPFDPADKPIWVRIIPSSMTGRRLSGESDYFDLPSDAYL